MTRAHDVLSPGPLIVAGPMLMGLTGAPEAGKDSAAAVLFCSHWGQAAFADQLRVEICEHWHVGMSLLVNRAQKEQPLPDLAAGFADSADWVHYCACQGWSLVQPRSPRWVMQTWGEWRRRADPEYWVRPIVAWVGQQRRTGHEQLVVSDVRHPNEAAALRALGGHIARVHRPGHGSPLATDTAAHISEQHGQIPADADIHNDGTLDHLAAEVWRVVHTISNTGASHHG